MTYQVLTRTGNDWTNCWTNFFSDDEGEPWVFATIEEAQAEMEMKASIGGAQARDVRAGRKRLIEAPKLAQGLTPQQVHAGLGAVGEGDDGRRHRH